MTLRRDAHGHVISVALARPNEDMQSGARVDAFAERGVAFHNGDVELSGSLLIPAGAGPHPAVAIVHGAARAPRAEASPRPRSMT